MLLALLGLALADAGEPPPPGVIAGEDLAAWQEILASRPEGEALQTALEAFLVAWPESALAEVAWTRLRDLGALDDFAARHPALEPTLVSLARSRARHEEELGRTAVATSIVRLDADGEPIVGASARKNRHRPRR